MRFRRAGLSQSKGQGTHDEEDVTMTVAHPVRMLWDEVPKNMKRTDCLIHVEIC
jgi:hypothetical protein